MTPPLDGKLIYRRLAPSSCWYSFIDGKLSQLFKCRQSRDSNREFCGWKTEISPAATTMPPLSNHSTLQPSPLPSSCLVRFDPFVIFSTKQCFHFCCLNNLQIYVGSKRRAKERIRQEDCQYGGECRVQGKSIIHVT